MDKIYVKMTLEELCKTYNFSESSVKTKFNRTAESFRKKYGLDLLKVKGLDGVHYEVAPTRALTMYDESKDEIFIPFDTIKMDDLLCLIIIGINATQFFVFKGTKKEFLDYLGLKHSQKNINSLDEALENYSNKQGSPLIYSEEGSRIIISFEESFEKQHILTTSMLRQCREIARKYNKQDLKIIQLLKVWQAYRINQYKGVNPLTNRDLQQYIDLSQKQIRDIRKLLKQQGIIDIKRVGAYKRRIGSQFDLNVFYDDKITVIKE